MNTEDLSDFQRIALESAIGILEPSRREEATDFVLKYAAYYLQGVRADKFAPRRSEVAGKLSRVERAAYELEGALRSLDEFSDSQLYFGTYEGASCFVDEHSDIYKLMDSAGLFDESRLTLLPALGPEHADHPWMRRLEALRNLVSSRLEEMPADTGGRARNMAREERGAPLYQLVFNATNLFRDLTGREATGTETGDFGVFVQGILSVAHGDQETPSLKRTLEQAVRARRRVDEIDVELADISRKLQGVGWGGHRDLRVRENELWLERDRLSIATPTPSST